VTEGDEVTVNASGAGGAVSIGDVTGSGDVTVDASGATGIATIGTVTGDNVTAKVAGSAATSSIGAITAKTSATLTYSAVDANTVSVTADTASTALAVSITGGVLVDAVTITGVSTQTGVTVTGDLGSGTDSLTINSSASAVAAGQTVTISGLTSYNAASITTGLGTDTITGGSGVDTIVAGQGKDTITGNAGADIFVFSTGDSNYDAPDTITDLGTTDVINWGNGSTTIATGITGSASAASISSGIATFDLTTTATSKDTLYEVVGLVDASTSSGQTAMFSFGGSTYFFIDTNGDNDIVVLLTGVVISTVTLNTTNNATGISGFGTA
jgi:hypothetical protein